MLTSKKKISLGLSHSNAANSLLNLPCVNKKMISNYKNKIMCR
jgi:hypothetical protein